MTSCIFKNRKKNEVERLRRHFKSTCHHLTQSYGVVTHKNKKRKREIYLYGNFPNYFYERYKKRKKKCEEIMEDGIMKWHKEEDELFKKKERICKVIDVIETDEKLCIDDYRLTHVNSLMDGIFHGKDILDIGCNCGITTFLLSLKYKCRIVNAIDIDNSLINNNITLLKIFIEFVLIYNNQSHMIPFFLRCRNLTQLQKDILLEVHLLHERAKKLEEGNLKKLEEGNLKKLEEGNLKKLEVGNLKKLEVGNLKKLEEGNLKKLEEGNLKKLEEGNLKKLEVGNLKKLEVGNEKNMPVQCMPLESKRRDRENALCEYNFPFNIYFSCLNIFDEIFENVQKKYDVIICFSVLKWIHLIYGDNQVILFFDRMHNLLKEGGYLVLEYHNERKYKIKKCDREYYKHETKLNYKHFDAIARGEYENNCKMVLVQRTIFDANLAEGQKKCKKEPGMFSRTVCVYQKV
ncbi:bicoid-interacting protein BIN3 [Plasmodium gonderi]|uniref:RNA methyltransferase n=1 Tax=Plasmodium gonderi TaxID=77519 RepID=A0A1Y1JHT1_PLAGO|nr:bicoid-interacting protein BIN3 [Plasmodium gonderi]GAW81218.1 bicoid-interacting protein BIN3 [Plasmodium gonderi]